jgi:hypothetical protein
MNKQKVLELAVKYGRLRKQAEEKSTSILAGLAAMDAAKALQDEVTKDTGKAVIEAAEEYVGSPIGIPSLDAYNRLKAAVKEHQESRG